MCLKKRASFLSQFGAEILEFKVGRVLFLSSVGFCVIIFVVFEQDIIFGAYLTLQAESTEGCRCV